MLVWKMHSCGNDYCVVKYDDAEDFNELAVKLCNRFTGIGADGLIVVKDNPVELICYNSFGDRIMINGNAVFCFTKYALEHNMIKKNRLQFVSGVNKITADVTSRYPFYCKVEMGKPNFSNPMLYITDSVDSFGRVLDLGDRGVTTYSLHFGRVHTVVFVPDFESELIEYAEKISKHKIFNRFTNVSFVQIKNRNKIKVKTYEINLGFTKACATAACASVIAGNKIGLLNSNVAVEYEYGALDIEYIKDTVYLSGPAIKTFECEYEGE